MKVLLVFDEHAIGSTLEVVLKAHGHEARYTPAPLFAQEGTAMYTPEIADRIEGAARELVPDWVILSLQGRDSSEQVIMSPQKGDSSEQMNVAKAIHEQTPTAKFLFVSGGFHNKQMDSASAYGLDSRFRFMPFDVAELLAILEKPPYGGQWQRVS